MTKQYDIDIDGFAKWLRTEKLAERTISTYAEHMRYYSRRFDKFDSLNNMELVDGYIETEKSPATINSKIGALNAYTRYLMSKGEPLEDWIMLVTSVPQAVAAKRLVVAMPKSWRILSPDTFCRPSLIIFIPNKKIARPPNKLSILSKVDI